MARLLPKNEKRSELVGGFVTPSVKRIIAQIAEKEERTVSSTLARLLDEHPQIKRALRAERAQHA